MAKAPHESEVIMFGDKTEAPKQRAEIITFDKDGKEQVSHGGHSRKPMKDRTKKAPENTVDAAPPKPAAAPAPAPKKSASQITGQKAAKPANPASSEDVSKAMVSDTMGSLMSDMRAKAQAKGGVLSLQDLDVVEAEMAQKAKDMEAQFAAKLEDFAAAAERQKWDAERDEPFYRLLVKQFSHLFKEPASPKSVSRRMLPGFFMAVDMLLGPDVVTSSQSRCKAMVARLRTEASPGAFDWETYYKSRDAVIVSLDAQVQIVSRFADYDKRLRWFIDLVNSNLRGTSSDMPEAEAKWTLQEQATRRLLDALTADLRKVLSSDKGRERLIKRHGGEVVGDAIVALKRIVTG